MVIKLGKEMKKMRKQECIEGVINPQQVGRIRKRGQDGTGFYDENIT